MEITRWVCDVGPIVKVTPTIKWDKSSLEGGWAKVKPITFALSASTFLDTNVGYSKC